MGSSIKEIRTNLRFAQDKKLYTALVLIRLYLEDGDGAVGIFHFDLLDGNVGNSFTFQNIAKLINFVINKSGAVISHCHGSVKDQNAGGIVLSRDWFRVVGTRAGIERGFIFAKVH